VGASPRGRRIRYLEAAADEVRQLHRQDRALALIVLQRLTDLAKGRLVGEPLERRPSADLSDCRKVYIGRIGGRPTHRIVYRELGDGAVEVIEVVAVGAREGMAVYLEAAQRLGRTDPE
jgi:ParE-like toxin of type II ParDE toxin-antitoxin system